MRLLLLVTVIGVLEPLTAQSGVGIQRVAWLQGCWESVRGGARGAQLPDQVIEEHWMAPRGKSMLGMGRTTRGETLVEYELVVIREDGDKLAYEAHPSGQPSAVFLSKEVTDTTVVFENSEHDFPQRVGYQRKDPDSLLAWIEGTQKGQLRRIEFPYRRAACAGR